MEFIDQVQRDIGASGLAFLGLNKLATSKGPASQTLDSNLRAQRVVQA
jgi:hypothetical protein